MTALDKLLCDLETKAMAALHGDSLRVFACDPKTIRLLVAAVQIARQHEGEDGMLDAAIANLERHAEKLSGGTGR